MMRRGAALLALLLGLLGVAGCGIPTDDEPRPLADETTTSTTEAADVEPGDPDTDVYLVVGTSDNAQPSSELEARPRALSGPETPDTVLEALLLPASDEETAAGYQNYIPQGTRVLSVEQDGERVTVNMSTEWSQLGGPTALTAYAQVVLTLTDLPGVDEVQFLIDDEGVRAPTVNDGLIEVVDASDYTELDPTPE